MSKQVLLHTFTTSGGTNQKVDFNIDLKCTLTANGLASNEEIILYIFVGDSTDATQIADDNNYLELKIENSSVKLEPENNLRELCGSGRFRLQMATAPASNVKVARTL